MLQAHTPGTGEAVNAQKDYVAGHRIRENVSMPHIREAIQKTSGRRQQRADTQRSHPLSRVIKGGWSH
jgi:hypothetical protein